MRSSLAEAGPRSGAPVSVDVDAPTTCPRCGRVVVWSALARMSVLEGSALESYLAVPPDGWFVEVRACSGCGRSLARKVRAERGQGW